MEKIKQNLTELNELIKKQNLEGEIIYKSDHTNMIRAGRSQISLNVTEIREHYGITLKKDKKMICGSSINMEDAKQAIIDLSSKIEKMPEVPFVTPMETLNGKDGINNKFDTSLEEIDSTLMVDIYKKADELFKTKHKDNHISGSFSAGSYSYGITNTKTQTPLFHKATDFNGEVVVQMNAHDKKEIQQLYVGEQLSDLKIDFNELETLYENTEKTPYKVIDPGKYDVVFTSSGLAELLTYFTAVSMGEAKEYGYSYLNDEKKIGDQLFGKNITIFDRPCESSIYFNPFGKNGHKRGNKDIVKNGVLTDLFYSDKMTCDRFDKKVNSSDIDDFNLFVEPGSGPSELSEVIKDCKNPTIFMNYIHYLNFVNYSKLEFTGTSRFGTFLMEDGKLTHNIEKVRILDSIFTILNNVEYLSNQTKNVSCTHSYGYRETFAVNLPKFIKVNGVNLAN